MLLNKPLPNFLKTVLFITAASASATSFAANHGHAAETEAAKDAIEHATKDSAVTVDGTVLDEGAEAVETKETMTKEEMLKELEDKADSFQTEQ